MHCLLDQSFFLNFHKSQLMVIHFGYLVQNLAPLLRLHDALSRVDRDVTADFRKRFSLIQNSSNNMQHNLLQVSVNHNNQQYHLFCNIDLD